MTPPTAVPRLVVVPDRPGNPAPALPAPGELHLWQVAVRPRPAWLGLLDDAARQRWRDSRVDSVRDTLVTSHGAQRLIGAHYLGGEPTAVTISRHCAHCDADHGRPTLPDTDLDYSVSHTRDWVLVAVTAQGLVGVDLERLDPTRDIDRLAAAALSAAERERYAILAPERRPAWFLSAWTRKEAAMKVTGLGLAAWPDRVDVCGPVAAVQGLPRWPATPVYLYDLPGPAGHVAALAATVPIARARSFTI